MSKSLVPVNNVLNTFNILFKKVDVDLINRTGLFSDEVKKLYNERLPFLLDILKDKNLMAQPLAVEKNKEYLIKSCVKDVAKAHEGELSPFETREVMAILSRVSDQYDLGDARVYILIKSLINHVLSSVRFQIECMSSDTMYAVFNDKTGSTAYYVNPAEKFKLDFDNAVISAIEKLSKIIDGETINVVDVADSVRSVWERRKALLNKDKSDLKGLN